MSGKALWVPLDVNFLWDPAILGCDIEAQMLYVRSLCLSKQTGSNGSISRKQVASLCFDLLEQGARAVKQLLESELWVDDKEDYFIRSWFKYNKTPDELERLSNVRAKAGAKGGRAKPKQVASPASKQREAEVEVEVEVENSLPAAPPSASATNGKVTRSPKGTRVPDPFTVSEEMAEWAEREIPRFDWSRESKKFLDFWRAKAGKDAVKQDWPATWRNWMRRAAEGQYAR